MARGQPVLVLGAATAAGSCAPRSPTATSCASPTATRAGAHGRLPGPRVRRPRDAHRARAPTRPPASSRSRSRRRRAAAARQRPGRQGRGRATGATARRAAPSCRSPPCRGRPGRRQRCSSSTRRERRAPPAGGARPASPASASMVAGRPRRPASASSPTAPPTCTTAAPVRVVARRRLRRAPDEPLDFSVRRWQFTLVVFALLIALGLDRCSTSRARRTRASTSPGASVDRRPTPAPTRRTSSAGRRSDRGPLAELDDVKKLETSPSTASASCMIEFEAAPIPDEKYDEVMREIDALRLQLPAEIAASSRSARSSPALVNIVQYRAGQRGRAATASWRTWPRT